MDIATIFQNVLKILGKYWDVFLIEGLTNTLSLSAITVFFGAIFGALLALGKLSRFKVLRFCITAFVEIIRGTPILLQLYFGYFILPMLFPALGLSDYASIAVALVINSSAYVSEVFRSGIQAVDRGQSEAARSLGLNKAQTMIHVVLPQAVRNILPALGNEFVTLVKESSICSTIGVSELMFGANLTRGATYQTMGPLLLAAGLYLCMTFPASKLLGYVERRM
ncbi:MAG: amino acid ABC transporter permease, partial [Eubacteriales bacterium]|nr:amino acid ABC transporter permease [Eubacteriales bacterium]